MSSIMQTVAPLLFVELDQQTADRNPQAVAVKPEVKQDGWRVWLRYPRVYSVSGRGKP
jgi:hypothetical protein